MSIQTRLATPATFAAVLKSAQPGDTVAMTGDFGDLAIGARSATPAVNLVSADPAHPATVRSLALTKVTGLHISGVNVAYTPDAKTVSWSAAVTVSASADVVLEGMHIIGGPSVNGVAQSALATDATGNVIGLPAGYGVNVINSQNVQFVGNDVSQFDRGLILNNVSTVLIQHNAFHDRRRTAIAGAQVSDLTVDGNTISASAPWRWGDTPAGDHADCMAFWSNVGQTTPNARVKITNNLMEQLSGATILGMWFQGGTDGKSPFTDFEISGNILLVPNLQGIALFNSQNGVIARNTLIQAKVAGVTLVQRPTILLRANVTGVTMTGNRISAPISDLSGGVNPQSGNILLTGSVAGS